MASAWDYLTYGPQNPFLQVFSEAGRRTGVQDVSKKGLQIASDAGKPMRQALGYGEAYNITQEQAGEIGYFFGSLVTPGSMVVKAGSELVKVGRTGYALPGLLTVPGKFKKAEEVGGLIKATGKLKEGEGLIKGVEILKATKKAETVAEGAGFWGKIGTKLPSLGTSAKIVGTGAILGGGTWLAYQGATGAGDAIKRIFEGIAPTGDTKKDGIPGIPGLPGEPGQPGGYGWVDPYASFWGNVGSGLGAGLGGPGMGLGSGLADIGAGTGASIVPLAVVIGGAYLASQYMGKRKTRKDKGKKK